MKVSIIGAGLAGCEAALYLAKKNIYVDLYEQKPVYYSDAHKSPNFAELVCSNSLKNKDLTNACGLLKEEIAKLESALIPIARETAIAAGGALAVDRELFSSKITALINENEFINVITKKVESIPQGICIVATGPLTDGKLYGELENLTKVMHFFDCSAPLITAESIDFSKTFAMNRYGKGENDYINCPLTKEEYEMFADELCKAEVVIAKEFEKSEIFEGCMPVEIMAKRGKDSLRFGMMKPVGLYDENGKRPYAAVQLRRENAAANLFSPVGFQTNLKFGEQKRVFSLIPALKNAEFVRFGVMHRNSFIESNKVLNGYLQLKSDNNIFICGQLCGVEGYVESMATGLLCGINAANMINGKPLLKLSNKTVLGSLVNYITTTNELQPMNANFGIIEPIEIKDKTKKKENYAARSLEEIENVKFV